MKKETNIERVLGLEKQRTSKEEQLLAEAKKVLIQNRITDKNVLDNLKFYNTSFEFLDEDGLDEKIFSKAQLVNTCKKLHLRCLPSQAFEGEVPYEAILKIKELNKKYGKDLKHFKILSTKEFFSEPGSKHQALLFVQTLYGNYYHIHTWGEPLSNWRRAKYFILRNFESLAAVMLLFTLIECLIIPDRYLSTDTRATYFSMYRAAAYFHLLILNTGLTIFLLFAFHFSFSENNWDSPVRRKNL